VQPEWLPSKVVLNGSIQDCYKKLHDIYQSEIVSENIEIEGVPVIYNNRLDKTNPPYTHGFTHLVTRKVENQNDGFRVYDPNRAERLSWLVPLLKNYKDSCVSCFWFMTPDGAILGESLAIWLEEWDYLVVLKWVSIQKTEKVIATAHHVDMGNRHYWQNKRRRSTSRVLQF